MSGVHVFTDSDRVRRASYDETFSAVYVLFTDGVRWTYYGVSRQEYEDFTNAASPGRYIREVLDHKTHGPTSSYGGDGL